uniref:Uncharacterized protein n=1 Tax=Arundo donax TaxID=35708 RepID=A0A0A8YHL0_ARUDO
MTVQITGESYRFDPAATIATEVSLLSLLGPVYVFQMLLYIIYN